MPWGQDTKLKGLKERAGLCAFFQSLKFRILSPSHYHTTMPDAHDLGWISRFAAGLRFPVLFAIVAGVFVVDLFVPDMIPMVDEVLLALLTVMLGSIRRRRRDPAPDSKR